ncbi:hypothetical protein VH567_15530 [Sphingomonas sp. 4RDLI-65]|uniref:hypothetical protein n=1 Tax=Sphingomonas sp. 4RDLI-65 TaxID=3111641 RepID=UPI003C29DEC6
MISDATVRAIDGRAVVKVTGAELAGLVAGQAQLSADASAASASDSDASSELSAAKSVEASQYAAAAAAFANRYLTFAAGNAASAAGVDFTVVSADGKWVNVYRKGTSGDADQPIIRLPGAAAYASGEGSGLVGHNALGGAPNLALGGFLDRFGYWGEDMAGIQQANDMIVSSGDCRELRLKPGAEILVTGAGIRLDHAFVTLLHNGASLNGTTMQSGAILTLGGTMDAPYTQARNRFHTPMIVGPGATSNVDGLLLEQKVSIGGGPSHLELVGADINRCKRGLVFSDRAYIIKVSRPDIWGCGIGADILDAFDGGENIRLADGVIFQCAIAVRMANSNADLFADGMSFDHNEKLFDITNGLFEARGCHIENHDFTQIPITIAGNGASVIVDGGNRRLTGVPAGGRGSFPYWVSVAEGTHYREQNVEAIIDCTSTGAFATGAGQVTRGLMQMYQTAHQNCYMLHDTKSRFIDGDFSTMSDMAWVIPNFGQTSRYKDTHPASGDITVLSEGLTLTKKTFGGGSFSRFVVAVPAEMAGELLSGKLRISKPGDQSGTVFISRQWARIDPVPQGGVIPQAISIREIDGTSASFSSAAYSDTLVFGAASSSNRKPGGATHQLITFNCDGLSAGSFTVNGFNFDRIG